VFVIFLFSIFNNLNSLNLSTASPYPEVKAASSVKAILVRTTDTSKFSPPAPDTAGITYLSNKNTLLVSDSEVNEMPIFTGVNLFEVTINGILTKTSSTIPYSNEPTGLSYNPQNNHLFVSDDVSRRIYEVNPGSDGNYGTGDDTLSSFSTTSFGSTDPEGVAYGNNSLYIADGVANKIFQVSLNGNLVNSFSISQHGFNDPEGISFNHDRNSLFVVDRSTKGVIEITTSGELLTKIDISSANSKSPAGIIYAPASNSDSNNLYIVARGVDNDNDPNENDGKIYELSFESSSITSTPTSTNIPGDSNGDHIVNIQDYLVWLNYYYMSKYGSANADFNNSGFVDGIDYSIWNKFYSGATNTPTSIKYP